MLKQILVTAILLFSVIGASQNIKTFTITLPGEGGFSYVVQKAGESNESIPIDGKSVEVAAPDDPNGYSIYVIDSAINRAAKGDLVQVLKTKKFAPDSKAFTLVTQIDFLIEPQAGSLPAGTLAVTSDEKTETLLITQNDKNKATIYYWPSSHGEYKLTYESESKKKEVSGSFNAPSSMGTHTVSIPLEESFAEPSSPATNTDLGKKSQEKPQDSGGQSALATLMRLLIGLGIVGGLSYAAWWYYKNNQQVVDKLIDQSGLTAQAQSGADPTGALPPEPVKKDLQKIDLGSAASPLAATSAIPVTPATRNPRLVRSDGSLHLIQEGTATVGRESADLTLAGETGVSRNHATITRMGDHISVSDSGSTNGTYINGTKIATSTVLVPGDTVQFGPVSFKYEE